MFRPANAAPEPVSGGVHVVFQRGQLVSDLRSASPCLLPAQQLASGTWRIVEQQFLGFWHDEPCFATEIDGGDQLDPMQYQCGSLYQILGRVDAQVFALAGRASQILAWARDHRFCGRCGQSMELDVGERAMRCDPCRSVIYPRISPCIIVLVTRGEELLLARSPNFPRPMFSTLAGFIEAGESAEETLVREVREEVGVEVRNIQYFNSQSWPFPSQLMLGYFAEYDGGDIVCDPQEIAEADFFHYRDLPPIPPNSSISGQLIEHYINTIQS